MTGKVIGTYRIVQQLGLGLNGTVYQAVEQGRGQIVALKAIQPALAQQVAFKQNLRTIAATLTSMRHPNLAAFHTILQMGTELYVIGEFINGTPLNEALQRSGVLACEEATRLTVQVLEALSMVHAAGLWHGGIKPSNLMLTTAGEIKLTDLGIAQAAGRDLTTDGGGAAVLNYAAPEQLRGESCDARTDVYAMGAVLYEMLTGLPPFRRANDAALRHAHLEEPPPSPRTYFPLIPQPLEQAVLRALAKSPTARFSSAEAFRQALVSWADEANSADDLANAEEAQAAKELQANYATHLVEPAFRYESKRDRTASETPTPLTPNDWPQLTPQSSANKLSTISSVSSTGLNDEVVVELEEPAASKRSFWKPIAAVTSVATLLGATYAIVRVGNGSTTTLGPNQVAIRISPTLLPPTPSPTDVTVLTEATPDLIATEQSKITQSGRPPIAKPVRALPSTPVPKPKNAPTVKPATKLTPTKTTKAKPTPTPVSSKRKPVPTPTLASEKSAKKKKGGGVGGFLKGVFGGGGKDKKAEQTPKPKKGEPTPKPKKY